MKPCAPVLCVVLSLFACGRSELLTDAAEAADVDRALGVSNGTTAGPCAGADDELLRRWNVAVDAVGPMERDFHWVSVEQFPHPTWRFGDAIAYDGFVDVLLAFWGEPSNVEFAATCQLFDRSYASGPPVQRQCYAQLRPLTRELSTFSLVSTSRQQALERACTVIQAAAGPADGLVCP